MGSIVNEAGYVVLWHLGQLLLEYALQPRENDCAVSRAVVVYHAKLDFAITFLYDGGFLLV